MGRPLTSKWTGSIFNNDKPVLTPIANLDGNEYCIGYILRQVGSNKFLIQDTYNLTKKGVCQLVNGNSNQVGTCFLHWQTNLKEGYVARLTDDNLRDFNGNTMRWTMNPLIKSDTVAYITSNSNSNINNDVHSIMGNPTS